MAKLIPLFSGSKGNSYYIGSGGSGVLIDAGRSCKQIEQAMLTNGMSMNAVKAVFITHEHSDHCSGLRVLAARYNYPVFASAGTLKALEENDCIDNRISAAEISTEIPIGDMLVRRINTSHDTRESCCYSVILQDGRKAVIATDLGIMSQELRDEISTANLLLLESNHDVNMLKNGFYPYHLKRRILSDRGHLSNDLCAAELSNFIENGCNRIILAHLSQENNTPELALETSICELSSVGMRRGSDYSIDIAAPELREFSLVF